MDDATFKLIENLFAQKSGIDPNIYRHHYIKKRLTVRLKATRTEPLAYLRLLKTSSEELQLFVDDLTINVTQFFRDISTFRYLEKTLFPRMIEEKLSMRRPVLRLWCAGCSSGEEPYTLGLILNQLVKKSQHAFDFRIKGSDLDRNCIQQAKRGVYSSARMENVRRVHLEESFIPLGNDMFQVTENIRSKMRFIQEDLFAVTPELKSFDAIFCRNAIIYFPLHVQKPLFETFHASLKTGGFLVLGRSESLIREARHLFSAHHPRERVYLKSSSHL